MLTTIAANSEDEANAVAIQPDGRIVVAGSHQHGNRFAFALARYTPNGRLDPSFGGKGTVTTMVGSMSFASALAIQPDGDLVVGGGTSGKASTGFALARYKPDGGPDPGFGTCGTVTTSFSGGGPPETNTLHDERAARSKPAPARPRRGTRSSSCTCHHGSRLDSTSRDVVGSGRRTGSA